MTTKVNTGVSEALTLDQFICCSYINTHLCDTKIQKFLLDFLWLLKVIKLVYSRLRFLSDSLFEIQKMKAKQTILVIGGTGFISTHKMVQLLQEGFNVHIINNFDNSSMEAVHDVRQLVGPKLSKKLEFIGYLIYSLQSQNIEHMLCSEFGNSC